MTEVITGAASPARVAAEPTWTILCVDDEHNILAALRRLFRPYGYRVLVAGSGGEGLALLEREPVDVVMSDMRMPQMDGASFLEQVCERWPETVRLLLTGHADFDSTVGAINRGRIHRYISKPWDDRDVVAVVAHAMEHKALEREKRRLEVLTQQQNAQLRELNATLEAKVAQRTAALQDACTALSAANNQLKTNFVTSIKVFSNLSEMREGHRAGHARRVADLARQIAVAMALDPRNVQDVFLAGLLHEMGKLGFPESVANVPAAQLGGAALETYRKYPVRGEQALMPLNDLRAVAKIVRSQEERYDGQGFPDGLAGNAIPVGARIVAVARDYYAAQIGMLGRRAFTPAESGELIRHQRGQRYDAGVVDAWLSLNARVEAPAVPEVRLGVTGLKPGMVLARDLVTADGMLLLAAEFELDEDLIRRIRDYQHTIERPMAIYVVAQASP